MISHLNSTDDQWGDFQSSGAGGDFNPFSGSGGDFGPAATGHSQEPKPDDPWAKKGLFNLDQLNNVDKGCIFSILTSRARLTLLLLL
jgi:hypothetical protein